MFEVDTERGSGRTTHMLREAEAMLMYGPVMVVALNNAHIHYMMRIVRPDAGRRIKFVTHEAFLLNERQYIHTHMLFMDHAVLEQRMNARDRAAIEWAVQAAELRREQPWRYANALPLDVFGPPRTEVNYEEEVDDGYTIEEGWALLAKRKERLCN
jgi:hypothetical protein